MKANAESNYPNIGSGLLRTTGNVIASRLGKDRTHGGNYNWNGDIGELLIFSSALNDQQIEKMENHLINKWKIKRAVEITYAKPMAYLSFDDREETATKLSRSFQRCQYQWKQQRSGGEVW